MDRAGETDMVDKPLAGGLWRDKPETVEGKYLVIRRDGTIPQWPNFTLGADDPCAAAALRGYAAEAWRIGLDPAYCKAMDRLAEEWARRPHPGDPDRGRHREDLPAIIAMMRLGKGV